jgi:MacB-like periplasmic core domain/FtsX-like permease family
VHRVYLTENAGTFFGVRPLLGRNLEPSDAENGGQSVVVLNYRFWQRHFGGDPHIIGQTLEINHAAYTIIGVMPRSFAFNDTTGVGDVYLPDSLMRGLTNVLYRTYIPWIKLRPHVTLAAANAALEPIVRQFAKEHPERFPDYWHLALQPIIMPYHQAAGRTLTLLLAGVVLLLIIGCANCSILLRARGRARQHELAIRSAIGASRWRIVRQLLVEAVVISCTGAALGVGASYWLARLPLLLSPDSFPAESVIRINAPILRSLSCLRFSAASSSVWSPHCVSRAVIPRVCSPAGRLALSRLPQSIDGAFSSPHKSRSRFFSWPLRSPPSAAFLSLCKCRLATIRQMSWGSASCFTSMTQASGAAFCQGLYQTFGARPSNDQTGSRVIHSPSDAWFP